MPEPAPFRGPKEYCYYETFDARCSDDEVILMTSALYGRMRFGRCVKTNFGFMGCFTDVIDLLDRQCSGRRSCSVEVVEPTFDGVRPCNKELKCYLEVDYRCIKSTFHPVCTTTGLRFGVVVSVVGRINEVNQHRARLVRDG